MSSSETQKTPKRNLSLTFKSEKPHINPKLLVVDDDSLSTKTPEKPQHFRHKSLRESTQKQPTVQIDSARRKIETWPDENPNKTMLVPPRSYQKSMRYWVSFLIAWMLRFGCCG
ncbi:CDT1-like protein b [Prunus yedoensis var. nudiflora]|uniref:CDT1-like protein b n=1 Tax=Prunus yedoensis var. nudiflora TaxID=2094558 RepID=A0A314U8B5_PRUYE|nr:CDT1-like protein b [Prunus yedoensis var. nudiflora]